MTHEAGLRYWADGRAPMCGEVCMQLGSGRYTWRMSGSQAYVQFYGTSHKGASGTQMSSHEYTPLAPREDITWASTRNPLPPSAIATSDI